MTCRADDEENTAFMTAAAHGHAQILKYAVEELKCDINAKKKNGISLLHLACSQQKDHALFDYLVGLVIFRFFSLILLARYSSRHSLGAWVTPRVGYLS